MMPPTTVPAAPSIPWQKWRLANGLQVIFAVDRRLPAVQLNLCYRVGAKDEEPGRTGLAHLAEHVMLGRSHNTWDSYGSMMERAGGITNGATDQDRTTFFETLPTGALEYALWLESDRLATMSGVLTQTLLENQKSVIANELRLARSIPFGIFDEVLLKNLFPPGHPYGHPTGGFLNDLRKFSIDDTKEFLSTYYAPNNLSLAVVGDFDIAAAERWIAQYFASIPPAPPVVRPASWPTRGHKKVIDLDDCVAQERLYLAWIGPAFSSPERTRLDLAALILNRRLNAALVYCAAPPCSQVSVQNSVRADASVFLIAADLHKDESLSTVEQRIEVEIAGLCDAMPNESELQSARSKALYRQLSHFDTLHSIADILNRSNVFTGEPDHHALEWNRTEAASREEIAAAVSGFLDENACLRVRFHPAQTAAEANPKVDRSKPPVIHPDPPLQAPPVLGEKLSNGLDVFVSHRPGCGKVAVHFVTRAGVMFDPLEKSGLARIVATTVLNGTESRSSSMIRDQLELAGATALEPEIGTEAIGIGFDVLASGLSAALEILADSILNPAFRPFHFEGNRRRLQAALDQSVFDIDQTVNAAASSLVFGYDHPYARQSATTTGLSTLRCADLPGFYNTYWTPGRSALVFSGDVSPQIAFSLTRTHFGNWTGTPASAPPTPPPLLTEPSRVYWLDRPNAAQTVILQMLPAVSANSPERFPLQLVNRVWGGMWGSRLSRSLRETLGSTYAFTSNLSFFSHLGVWITGGAVDADKTRQSLLELNRQFDLLRTEPVSDRELRNAKGTEIRCWASAFETSAGIAALIAQSWTWQRATIDLQTEVDRMLEVTLEETRTVASRFASPKNVLFLLLGDRRQVEDSMQALDFGPAILVDALGRPLAKSGP
jgi:zinc protease